MSVSHPSTPPSPDSWSVLVTRENVHDLPIEHGFRVAGLGNLVRPVEFVVPNIGDPLVVVCDANGNFDELPIGFVPHMRPFSHRNPDDLMATFHHRKGGQTRREDFLRILRIALLDDPTGHPPATFRYGEHPDHPGERGFYVAAEHIGRIGLDYWGEQLLPPDQVQRKYFPIEVGGEAMF